MRVLTISRDVFAKPARTNILCSGTLRKAFGLMLQTVSILSSVPQVWRMGSDRAIG
ncbi:MAG: hypothetical protein NW220_18540 [Leptolyngbyaceae cyanobacterium bins.349]|nr:hypothetical protein [Leptolyngbyaceae cyanobacterium bins.349]